VSVEERVVEMAEEGRVQTEEMEALKAQIQFEKDLRERLTVEAQESVEAMDRIEEARAGERVAWEVSSRAAEERGNDLKARAEEIWAEARRLENVAATAQAELNEVKTRIAKQKELGARAREGADLHLAAERAACQEKEEAISGLRKKVAEVEAENRWLKFNSKVLKAREDEDALLDGVVVNALDITAQDGGVKEPLHVGFPISELNLLCLSPKSPVDLVCLSPKSPVEHLRPPLLDENTPSKLLQIDVSCAAWTKQSKEFEGKLGELEQSLETTAVAECDLEPEPDPLYE